jgi:tryptophan synthase alpha chain
MTIQRLQDKFTKVQSELRAAFITYIMACAPDKEVSLAALKGLPEAGADIIELGLPFSDPMADGVVIQKAAQDAINAGAKTKSVLEMVANFRESNKETPIILMGYYNPIQNYGLKKFCADAADAGVDGLLIVDLPPEEERDLKLAVESNNLAWIRLITPTTGEDRIKTIIKSASGFIYYVAVSGVTGTKSASYNSIDTAVTTIKKHTNLPVAVGFGIKSSNDVNNIAQRADAVVVGSAIVNELSGKQSPKDALDLVRELSSGLLKH